MKWRFSLLGVILACSMVAPANGGWLRSHRWTCLDGKCSALPAVVAASPDQAKLKAVPPAPDQVKPPKPDQAKKAKPDQTRKAK
jgi:hypothetical protein